jgi:hypothetical protein
MRLQRLLNMVVPLLLVCLFLFTAKPGFSQVSYDTATLQGTVLDSQGAAIPGATVSILNPATGLAKSMQSGQDGTYSFPLLPPGAYEVNVSAAGFDKAVANGINLPVGQAVIQDMHLTVGTTTTTVEVTSAAPLVSVEQTQQADSINPTQVAELPNVNHTFDSYVLTLPGVTNIQTINSSGSQRNSPGTTNAFATAGSNGRGGLVYIDGAEDDTGQGISRAYHLPVDAIQEFQVNRSGYNAEYGFTYAEAVTIVTKSGTNTVHGTLFGTFRDEGTDAHQYFQPLAYRNPITNALVYNQVSGDKPFDQEYHLGGSVGGPIVKNKLFFFASYEFFQNAFLTGRSFLTPVSQGITAGQTKYIGDITTTGGSCGVLTCAQLATDLSTKLIPTNNLVVNQLIGNGVAGFPNQSGAFTNKNNWHDGILRFDWQPNSADSFVFRSLVEVQDSPGNFGGTEYAQNAAAAPNSAVLITNRDYEGVGVWNHIFSPTLFNAFRFQFVPEWTTNNIQIPAQLSPQIPFSVIPGFANFGALQPGRVREIRYQFEDSTTWTKGSHSIKFGASFRPVKYVYFDPLYAPSQIAYPSSAPLTKAGGPAGGNPIGAYTPPLNANDVSAIGTFNTNNPGFTADFNGAALNGLQNFAAVNPNQFRTSFGTNHWTGWGEYGGVYIQDTWKINPRLTITPGVRFDVNAEPFPTGGVDNNVCELGNTVLPTVNNVATLQGAIRTAAAGLGTYGAPAIQAACIPANGGQILSFPTNPGGNHTQYVSPRLGLAFDITGDGKTLLRAAGGRFVGASELPAVFWSNEYNPNGKYLIQQEVTAGTDPAFNTMITNSVAAGHLPVFRPTVADFASAGIAPVPDGPHGVYIVAADSLRCGNHNPYGCGTYRSTSSTQASISIQRQLAAHDSLEVAYNFQRTFHLQDPQEQAFEQAVSDTSDPAGPGHPLLDPLQGPMVVPFSVNTETGTVYCSCGDAYFNALTGTYKRQMSHNFQAQVNWTYSRAIDDVLDFSSFNSSYFPTIYPLGTNGNGRDKGLSAYNTTHVIVANAVYNSPFKGGSGSGIAHKMLADWTLSPIITLRSGIPFQVAINPGQGLAPIGFTGAGTPTGIVCTTVAGCANGITQGTQTAYAVGNGLVQEAQNQARPYQAPRDSSYGPWAYRWDMSFKRGFRVNERLRIDFQANFANILNHVNFLGVNGFFSLAQYNQSTAQHASILNGQTVNLLSGPFVFKGQKSFNQLEKAQQLCTLPGSTSACPSGPKPNSLGGDPLSFKTADVPRQGQFELRLTF